MRHISELYLGDEKLETVTEMYEFVSREELL
jgi:hypothetical protein